MKPDSILIIILGREGRCLWPYRLHAFFELEQGWVGESTDRESRSDVAYDRQNWSVPDQT